MDTQQQTPPADAPRPHWGDWCGFRPLADPPRDVELSPAAFALLGDPVAYVVTGTELLGCGIVPGDTLIVDRADRAPEPGALIVVWGGAADPAPPDRADLPPSLLGLSASVLARLTPVRAVPLVGLILAPQHRTRARQPHRPARPAPRLSRAARHLRLRLRRPADRRDGGLLRDRRAGCLGRLGGVRLGGLGLERQHRWRPSPPESAGGHDRPARHEGGSPMKIRAFAPLTATLDLDPTDCLVLADALACALYHDQAPDRNLTAALRATLEACAVIAATDTLRDNRTPEAGMLEDTRRVWGPFDHAPVGPSRMVKRPQ